MVINMGRKIARFTMSGIPKPLKKIIKPKVIVNEVGNEIIIEDTEPIKTLKLEAKPDAMRDKSPTVVIIFVVIGVVVIAVIIGLILFFVRKNRIKLALATKRAAENLDS
jgi:hypothetical protein